MGFLNEINRICHVIRYKLCFLENSIALFHTFFPVVSKLLHFNYLSWKFIWLYTCHGNVLCTATSATEGLGDSHLLCARG